VRLEKIGAHGADNLYRNPDSGIIYFRQFKKGRGALFKSTRTAHLPSAKKVADEIRLAFSKNEKLASQPKSALELFDEWVKRKESARKSTATITSILSSRKHLEPYLFVRPPDQLTASFWESIYIPEIRLKTSPDRKFFNDRKWLLSFLRQMKEDGVIEKVPRLINPDPPRKPGKVFTDEEIGLLINFSSDYLRLAILMAATMGMRRGEVFGLRWDRVDFAKGIISLHPEDTKTRKARAFAISQSVSPELIARAHNGSDFVFPHRDNISKPMDKDGFRTAWDTLKSQFDITGKFHELRHTFLTKAFMAPNANAALICHYAGLSLEVAVRTYLHFNEEDSRQVASLVQYA
jgi:integrase